MDTLEKKGPALRRENIKGYSEKARTAGVGRAPDRGCRW